MKFLVLLIVCLFFQSCLKDVEPLERSSKFALIAELDDMEGEWFKFHKVDKKFHVLYPDYYELTITFEIVDSYLLDNDFAIEIKINDLATVYDYPKKHVMTRSSSYFSVTLANYHNDEIERCFNVFFNVEGGVGKYGEIDYCEII